MFKVKPVVTSQGTAWQVFIKQTYSKGPLKSHEVVLASFSTEEAANKYAAICNVKKGVV